MVLFSLPKEGKRNVLITAALPYVNNVPHLGNIIGSLLSADVYARYCRSRGYTTLFISGTDEYGTATETKAIQEGLSCQALCDKFYSVHKDVYEWFSISTDFFGRSATPLQTEITQDIFKKLHSNQLVFDESVDQLYCAGCERFLADRFVEGTCVFCSYEDARGDQCDKCGKLLNAITDLKNPLCKLDGGSPIVRSSRHLFLDLPKLSDPCQQWMNKLLSRRKDARWSQNAVDITESWFSRGLHPRCITRDLQWGVPVPLPSFEDKVFYVWFDACIGYISITANYLQGKDSNNEKLWKRWWQNPEKVELVQFMGKDNVPFHTVVFPSCLIGTKDPYTMLHSLSTTEYLNYEDGKFSKSRNVGVFGDQAALTGIPCSVWRYYLLINRPELSDTVFSWDDFQKKNNGDLVGNLGNFVSRVVKFVSKSYHGKCPTRASSCLGRVEIQFMEQVNGRLNEYIECMESVKLKAALKHVMAISDLCNGYLTASSLTAALFLNEREKCSTVLSLSVNAIYLISSLLYPFLPDTSRCIVRQLNAPLRCIPSEVPYAFDDIPSDHVLGTPEHLFRRLEDGDIREFRSNFSGGSSTITKKRQEENEKHMDKSVSAAQEANALLGKLSISCSE